MTKALSRNVTENTDWIVCPGCQAMIYTKRLARNLQVCPDCGSHHRLTAQQRIEFRAGEYSTAIVDQVLRERAHTAHSRRAG
jgi:acetyl-CoA carboxylase beta subunit